MRVTRIRSRETLAQPAIAQLVLRGARACGFPTPSAVLAELLIDPGSELAGLFLGMADERPCFVVVGYLPLSAFQLAGQILLAYSERAPHELVRLTGAALREWFQGHGHDHVHVCNFLHTDRSYMRGLAHFGRPRKIGSMIEFRFD